MNNSWAVKIRPLFEDKEYTLRLNGDNWGEVEGKLRSLFNQWYDKTNTVYQVISIERVA